MKKVVVFLLVLICGAASAEEAGENKYSIYFSGVSKHFGGEIDYNEKNYGVGFRYKMAEVMIVNNSYSKWGIGAYFHPSYKTKYIDFGVRMGATTGYESTPQNSKLQMILHPNITIKYKSVGLEFGLIPCFKYCDVKSVGTAMLSYSF